ncbi:excisionase [Bacillus wiedmannii]|uniref:Excisionase n=1 Tax=Bacillus wiedmannii TaxID=1890302 RepID=A0A2A7VQJ7_9BACI|nr:helix-turn-helix domain-containing protein [Bacillus wiedmannii]PEI99644.1 excisionase [Bacillus wiedmannii]
MSESFYTIKEIAIHLKVSEKTVSNWIKDGALESYKVGRLVRISEEHLQNFLTNKNGEN